MTDDDDGSMELDADGGGAEQANAVEGIGFRQDSIYSPQVQAARKVFSLFNSQQDDVNVVWEDPKCDEQFTAITTTIDELRAQRRVIAAMPCGQDKVVATDEYVTKANELDSREEARKAKMDRVGADVRWQVDLVLIDAIKAHLEADPSTDSLQKIQHRFSPSLKSEDRAKRFVQAASVCRLTNLGPSIFKLLESARANVLKHAAENDLCGAQTMCVANVLTFLPYMVCFMHWCVDDDEAQDRVRVKLSRGLASLAGIPDETEIEFDADLVRHAAKDMDCIRDLLLPDAAAEGSSGARRRPHEKLGDNDFRLRVARIEKAWDTKKVKLLAKEKKKQYKSHGAYHTSPVLAKRLADFAVTNFVLPIFGFGGETRDRIQCVDFFAGNGTLLMAYLERVSVDVPDYETPALAGPAAFGFDIAPPSNLPEDRYHIPIEVMDTLKPADGGTALKESFGKQVATWPGDDGDRTAVVGLTNPPFKHDMDGIILHLKHTALVVALLPQSWSIHPNVERLVTENVWASSTREVIKACGKNFVFPDGTDAGNELVTEMVAFTNTPNRRGFEPLKAVPVPDDAALFAKTGVHVSIRKRSEVLRALRGEAAVGDNDIVLQDCDIVLSIAAFMSNKKLITVLRKSDTWGRLGGDAAAASDVEDWVGEDEADGLEDEENLKPSTRPRAQCDWVVLITFDGDYGAAARLRAESVVAVLCMSSMFLEAMQYRHLTPRGGLYPQAWRLRRLLASDGTDTAAGFNFLAALQRVDAGGCKVDVNGRATILLGECQKTLSQWQPDRAHSGGGLVDLVLGSPPPVLFATLTGDEQMDWMDRMKKVFEAAAKVTKRNAFFVFEWNEVGDHIQSFCGPWGQTGTVTRVGSKSTSKWYVLCKTGDKKLEDAVIQAGQCDDDNPVTTTFDSHGHVAFCEQVIHRYSKRGNLVLDPWTRNGTTGVAALHLARRFLGCEVVPAYAAEAAERLRTTKEKMESGALVELQGGAGAGERVQEWPEYPVTLTFSPGGFHADGFDGRFAKVLERSSIAMEIQRHETAMVSMMQQLHSDSPALLTALAGDDFSHVRDTVKRCLDVLDILVDSRRGFCSTQSPFDISGPWDPFNNDATHGESVLDWIRRTVEDIKGVVEDSDGRVTNFDQKHREAEQQQISAHQRAAEAVGDPSLGYDYDDELRAVDETLAAFDAVTSMLDVIRAIMPSAAIERRKEGVMTTLHALMDAERCAIKYRNVDEKMLPHCKVARAAGWRKVNNLRAALEVELAPFYAFWDRHWGNRLDNTPSDLETLLDCFRAASGT